MRANSLILAVSILSVGGSAVVANPGTAPVADDVIAAQRAALAAASAGAGPQAPRDIGSAAGTNPLRFGAAPPRRQMNLCNIHFHEGAEHRGGEFTTFSGNGDGEGTGTGFLFDGSLSPAELAPFDPLVGVSEHGDLAPGDTIEIHYVYSTADVGPGPTLGACLNEQIANPQLRVQAYVFVLVNDDSAASMVALNRLDVVDGFWQAVAKPEAGEPVVYAGSTTGPSYNNVPSPFQVTWAVHPQVTKVHIASVAEWLADNPFEETGAHGVRNLVVNPDLLSDMTETGD